MQYKQAKICIFVAYLGLLINLGPSLHHADLFGFHDGTGSCSSCCHCQALPHPAESSENLVVDRSTHGHDCPFCQFFDQLHVIVDANETFEFSELASIISARRPINGRWSTFFPVARGPPAAV